MVGILARAQEKYPLRVHAVVAASNHYHLILTPDDAVQLADFMEFVNGNGMDKIRHQNAFERPARFKPSPRPRCHAACQEMRKRFRQALRGFVDMFREAAAKLKLGNVGAAIFPKGSFRPSLGFVSTGEEIDPLADAGGSRNFAILVAS